MPRCTAPANECAPSLAMRSRVLRYGMSRRFQAACLAVLFKRLARTGTLNNCFCLSSVKGTESQSLHLWRLSASKPSSQWAETAL